MSNKEKNIICITGMDGTGKSTLIEGLKNELQDVYVAEIWDALSEKGGQIFSSKKQIDDYLCMLTSDSRLLFLTHALKYSMDKALQAKENIVIFNGYFPKYFSSELALGASENLALSLIQIFIQPSITIQLTIDEITAADRKTKWSRYECGLSETPNKKDFIQFQNKVKPHWEKFKTGNWKELSTFGTKEDLLKIVLEIIK